MRIEKVTGDDDCQLYDARFMTRGMADDHDQI
jgi:hypothetical protein